MVFILLGMKRGAIIIGVVCLICFLWNNIKNANKSKKKGLLFLSLVMCFVGYLVVKYQMNESLYFNQRVEQTLEGNSSGRDELYRVFWNYFIDKATPLQFAFGSGADATLKVASYYAHNDWLEIAVNQGILGLIIYLLYLMLFARECLLKFYNNQTKLALQISFIICFMKTLFSMSYNDMPISAAFVLGYCLAQEKKE